MVQNPYQTFKPVTPPERREAVAQIMGLTPREAGHLFWTLEDRFQLMQFAKHLQLPGCDAKLYLHLFALPYISDSRTVEIVQSHELLEFDTSRGRVEFPERERSVQYGHDLPYRAVERTRVPWFLLDIPYGRREGRCLEPPLPAFIDGIFA